MGGGPPGAGGGVGVGAGGGVPAAGVAVRLPPRISPFITDGMSVRNSSFLHGGARDPAEDRDDRLPDAEAVELHLRDALGILEVERFDRDLRSQTLPAHDELPLRDLEMQAGHAAVHRVGLDRRLRISLDLERVLGNRGDAARDEIGLDLETAVLDEVGDTVEGFRKRSRPARSREMRWPPARRSPERRSPPAPRGPAAPAQDRQPPKWPARAPESARRILSGDITGYVERPATYSAPMNATRTAVYMPAPGRPLEMQSVPAPTPREGGAILETVASEVCGTDVHLHHGRLSGVPYPIIPGHVSVGRVLETRRAARRRRGPADLRGRARHVLRRLRNLRRLLALPRRPRGDALSEAPRLRHHGAVGGRAPRRLVRADRDPSRREARLAARGAVRGGVPGRRLRPADRAFTPSSARGSRWATRSSSRARARSA